MPKVVRFVCKGVLLALCVANSARAQWLDAPRRELHPQQLDASHASADAVFAAKRSQKEPAELKLLRDSVNEMHQALEGLAKPAPSDGAASTSVTAVSWSTRTQGARSALSRLRSQRTKVEAIAPPDPVVREATRKLRELEEQVGSALDSPPKTRMARIAAASKALTLQKSSQLSPSSGTQPTLTVRKRTWK